MNTKNGATNGTTAKQLPTTNGKQVSTVSELKPQPKEETKPNLKAELPAIIPSKKEEQKASIEDRFLKMDVLFSKREKWEKIKDSLDKLNKFKLSTDGRTDNIIFKDSAGVTFSTYNPDVITKVVDMLKEDLTKKLAEVEGEINL